MCQVKIYNRHEILKQIYENDYPLCTQISNNLQDLKTVEVLEIDNQAR
jgi:hypothetical protein